MTFLQRGRIFRPFWPENFERSWQLWFRLIFFKNLKEGGWERIREFLGFSLFLSSRKKWKKDQEQNQTIKVDSQLLRNHKKGGGTLDYYIIIIFRQWDGVEIKYAWGEISSATGPLLLRVDTRKGVDTNGQEQQEWQAGDRNNNRVSREQLDRH